MKNVIEVIFSGGGDEDGESGGVSEVDGLM